MMKAVQLDFNCETRWACVVLHRLVDNQEMPDTLPMVDVRAHCLELSGRIFCELCFPFLMGAIMSNRNARIGLVLFFVYTSLYLGFVFLNAFSAERMEATPWAGVNLAILYGFGLIVAALVLAVIYGLLCGLPSAKDEGEQP